MRTCLYDQSLLQRNRGSLLLFTNTVVRQHQRKEKRSQNQNGYGAKHCPHVAQSTTNIRNHLRVAHEIVVPTAISAVRTIAAETVESLYTKLLLQLGDKDSLDQEILRRTVSQSVVSHTLLDLVVVRRLPFSCVEWPEFHALFKR